MDANVLIMGLTFKENCPDLRNTRVIDLVNEFKGFNFNVDIYDPWVDKNDAINEYDIKPIDYPIERKYDAILLAVAHDKFKELTLKQIKDFGKDNHVIYDIKYLLKTNEADGRL
jgi:UDP-N-acetyl-D-galactosamine dehydrogenase